jgi:flagellar biosynthesis/type III secretory pathway M-ring protein FliF/YscJ
LRSQYILGLKETQDVAFQSLEYASSVSPVITFQPSQLQQQSNSNTSISFLQTNITWIVGVAAFVCVIVLLISNYIFRAYKRQHSGEDSSTTKESSTTVSEHHVPRDVTVLPNDHHSTTDSNSVNTYLIESHFSEYENMLLDLKPPEKL